MLFLIVAVVTFFGVFITLNKFKNKLVSEVDLVATDADLSIKKVHYTQTDEGRKAWQLDAESARYFKGKEEILLEKVRAVFYDQEGETITLTGDQGKIMSNSKDMEIIGNIVATSTKGYLLYTDSLKYIMDQKKICTNDHIKITGERLKIEGEGLSMDISGENLSILRNVKSSFKELKFF